MALKGDRVIVETDIKLTCEAVAERGVVLVHDTSGSGVALGDRSGKATLAVDPSGAKVAGVLLNDVVNIDQTRFHRNFHKDETQVGEPCTLLKKGTVTSNKISGTPTVGATAYLTANGQFTPTMSATGGLVATPKVGQFASIKDENGYATIDVNLPIV